MLIKIKTFVICLSMLFLITSCDYRPIEDMPMVFGLAIDPIEEGEGYKLTAKVIIPSGTASTEGMSEQVYIQSSGQTIFDAARDFILKEGQKVFWGQLNFVIINQKITERDITEVLDFFVRDNEIREDLWLLISKEDHTAEEVLRASYNPNRVRFYVADAMNNIDSIGKYSEKSLINFSIELEADGIEPILPLIDIEHTLGQDRIIINGICVFKDKKRIGHLNGKETQQFRLINGELAGVYVIDYKSEVGETKITLEIGDVDSKTKISKAGQVFDVNITVEITGVTGEIVNNDMSLSRMKEREDYIKKAEEQLNKELQALIVKMQKEYSSDIFGIGEKVKNKYPKAFKAVEKDWDAVFAASNIHVNTKIKLTGSALFKQPFFKEE